MVDVISTPLHEGLVDNFSKLRVYRPPPVEGLPRSVYRR